MVIFKTIYSLFKSFFDYISCKTMPIYESINSDEMETDYESIIFNQMETNLST